MNVQSPPLPWDTARPPRAIGFDLMDTLIRDPWREAVELVIGLTVEGSRPLRDRHAWPDFELGLLDEDQYARRFFLPESGRSLDVAWLKREFSSGYRFVEGMDELLAAVARTMAVHILSNYPCWYEDVRASFELDRYVTGHHPSYLVGARKPDPVYFHRVLERARLEPHELLFVDDREDNVLAARALGMPAIVFTDAPSLAAIISPLYG